MIEGRVQGVFLRKRTKQKARELGLKGWVKNLEDGRVEVVIEGKDENVNQMFEICEKGTQHTDIKDIQFEELKHQGFDGFKVMRM